MAMDELKKLKEDVMNLSDVVVDLEQFDANKIFGVCQATIGRCKSIIEVCENIQRAVRTNPVLRGQSEEGANIIINIIGDRKIKQQELIQTLMEKRKHGEWPLGQNRTLRLINYLIGTILEEERTENNIKFLSIIKKPEVKEDESKRDIL
jgi:hypothetical protein